ncbi:MAG: glycosyltransferase family 1 protein [Chloroherpetonaceae bacterium]|nr:glycosyltransferase family 4 protein [Chthonomonadaceae bacterium]MDW8206662.1 glycosyltransferase family 1 protein [Chloroherpetonaceae bacterium]
MPEPCDLTTSLRPHVLIDARYAPKLRGGDRCRYELARFMAGQQEWNVSFLVYPHAVQQACAWHTGASPIIAPFTPDQHPQADWYEHVTLPRLARQAGVDLYHGTFQTLPLRSPAPITVVTIQDMAVFAFPQAYSPRFVRYMRLWLGATIRRATQIIAPTMATRSEIVRFYPEAEPRITVIMNGVGQEFLSAAELPEPRIADVCHRLCVPRPYVLFVGSLEAKKNHRRLVEAFHRARVAGSLPHTLVIAGERLDSVPDGGITEAGAGPLVHFTGYVPEGDLPALYRGADLVAYPSLYEGFGMPVLEAMAAGVPVLTSSISSMPEVAGEAGMLVDPCDVDAIAQGLYRALTDHSWRQFAVQAGRKRALSLTWSENGRKTVELYTELWNRHRRTVL